jgi:ornithine carbamoyltransferase
MMKPTQTLKHYLQFKDLQAADYAYLFERTKIIKQRFKNYEKHTPLTDRTLAMIFEKASTRTRVSFEAGMYQMQVRAHLRQRPRHQPHGRFGDDAHL